MRLSSFLPMLLLLASPLAAQPICNIFDLTATVVQAPAPCQYFVVLDFEHNNTTNQFTVQGNGNNYGIFTYAQVPLTLGPFASSPNGPLQLEFAVTDAILLDCADNVTVTVPACGINQCEIHDVKVLTGDCLPGNLTYKLLLDFEVHGPTADFFEVWTSGGVSLGVFPLAGLPLAIPAFPSNGAAIDFLKICIAGNPDCCKVIEFETPDCILQGCGIIELTVSADSCTSDSTYLAKIDFDQIPPAQADSFQLWANGQFLGNYGTNQLPLTTPILWNGGPHDVIRVCIENSNSAICCKEKEFAVPACLPVVPCAISNLKIETDSCTTDSTFGFWVNFQVNDPTAVDSFKLWGNSEYLGQFGMNQLPLRIEDFLWNGLIFSEIRVCTGNLPGCCKEVLFLAPDCLPFGPCEVTELSVQTGPCSSDSTYKVTLHFNATNPGNGTVIVFGNNQLIDTFDLTDAPIVIPNFPWDGGQVDFVTICIDSTFSTPNGCCRTEEFLVPNCLFPDLCVISDVVVDPGLCNPATNTYSLWLNFQVDNPGNDFFEVWSGTGIYIGLFQLNQLPLLIPNFPASGNPNDVIKICINDHPDCCVTIEFDAPDCNIDPCEIFNLHVQTGTCHPDQGTYEVWVDFDVQNPTAQTFGLWANGQLFGFFNLADLPLYIPNFPWGGGNNDVIKVCIASNIGTLTCCRTIEFEAPDCVGNPDCDINDLVVDTGDCTSDSTYNLLVNFQVSNPPGNLFGVWINGQFVGNFELSQLPLHLPNVHWNGGNNDVIKICFSNTPAGPQCCAELEYEVPDCLGNNDDCHIHDLVVDPGDCTSDSTYSLHVNFQVTNPPGNVFGVWANGQFFDNFELSQLPLLIPNFPWNGGNNDVIKICFPNSAGAAGCCATLEFEVPDCLGNNDCEIYDFHVETGNCESDSTYIVVIDFEVANATGTTFGVWANGQFLGDFNLNQLPLTIPNFPWNGGPNDVVKVCMNNLNVPPGGQCCKTVEFPVPDCLGDDDCHIWDLHVVRTPCLCGQFFALISFNHDNGGNDGFDIVGNGNNYGNFPYNTPQPIILGPFNGDGTTIYEFGVVDHNNPDCQDGFVLGQVECQTPVVEPGGTSSLVLSPNPTANWLNVTAMMDNGGTIGQAKVEVYHADGRLVLTQTVANAANFQLDVANLPAGVYRLVLLEMLRDWKGRLRSSRGNDER